MTEVLRLCCPLCGETSTCCDRDVVANRARPWLWWEEHKAAVHPLPAPIVQSVTIAETEWKSP